MNIEEQTEQDIDNAVKYADKSNKNLILAGMYAHRVVGKYEKYGSAAIAQRAGRSPSTVENWAHGYEIFSMVIKFGGGSEIAKKVKKNWRLFTPTHFWTAWDKMNKYCLTPLRVIGYLNEMLNYRAQGLPWSSDALAREIEAHENKEGNTPDWSYYSPKVRRLYQEIAVLKDAPAPVRKWLLAAPQEVR